MSIQSPGGGGVSTFATYYDELSPGVLMAVSIITEFLYVPPKATWCCLSITDQAQTGEARKIVVVQGYPSHEHPLTWFGIIPIQSGMFYTLQLRGNLNPVFRVEDIKLPFDEYTRIFNGQPPAPAA